MFGTYRFILAAIVALSHFGLIFNGFNPGQWAVLSFYVISGFLMERLHEKIQKFTDKASSSAFYSDRFLRILPLYLVVLGLSLWTNWQEFQPWIVSNIALIPLNYGAFTGSKAAIGPAWSLACEFQFYMLIPLLCRMSNSVLKYTLMGSVFVFCISPFTHHSAFWGYMGLPGILFAFLSGMLLSRGEVVFLKIIWMLFVVLLVVFASTKFISAGLPTGININVCIGYLLAIPSTWFLSRISPTVSWDKRMGLISYPLFLVHELVQRWMSVFLGYCPIFMILIASAVVAVFLVLVVESPFDLIRYRVRTFFAKKDYPIHVGIR